MLFHTGAIHKCGMDLWIFILPFLTCKACTLSLLQNLSFLCKNLLHMKRICSLLSIENPILIFLSSILEWKGSPIAALLELRVRESSWTSLPGVSSCHAKQSAGTPELWTLPKFDFVHGDSCYEITLKKNKDSIGQTCSFTDRSKSRLFLLHRSSKLSVQTHSNFFYTFPCKKYLQGNLHLVWGSLQCRSAPVKTQYSPGIMKSGIC